MKKLLHFIVMACAVIILVAAISSIVFYVREIRGYLELELIISHYIYLLIINIIAVIATVGIIAVDLRALLIDFSPALQKRAKEREEARRVKAEENRLRQIDEREKRIKQLEEELNNLKKGE